jgi:transcriptional regulator with XRE-family HTH domain
MSQMTLAEAVQVQRSAVSHWESAQAKNPSVSHLREIAMATGVQFEWLVTGRGG